VELLEILNIPFIIVLGIATSLSDIKAMRISNRWIIASAAYAALTLGISVVVVISRGESVNIGFFSYYLINASAALVLGFFMWVAKLWSAGDGKLFFAYALLIPSSIFVYRDVNILPSYVILVNTFTPAFLVFSASLLVRGRLIRELPGWFFSRRNLLFMLKSFLFVFGLAGLWSRAAPGIFGLSVLMLLMLLLAKLRVDATPASALLSVARLLGEPSSVGQLLPTCFQVALMIVLIKFLIELSFSAYTSQTYIESLEPGMRLAENVMASGDGFRIERSSPISILDSAMSRLSRKPAAVEAGERLDEEQVQLLKKLHSEGKLKEHTVLIHRSTSFAGYLFIGAIITILFHGDVLFAIRGFAETFI